MPCTGCARAREVAKETEGRGRHAPTQPNRIAEFRDRRGVCLGVWRDGAPAPVESVAVLPPRRSIDPICDLERSAANDSPELRIKYALGMKNIAASVALGGRQITRNRSGARIVEDYVPEIWRDHLPNIIPEQLREPRANSRDLWIAFVGHRVTAVCVGWIRRSDERLQFSSPL